MFWIRQKHSSSLVGCSSGSSGGRRYCQAAIQIQPRTFIQRGLLFVMKALQKPAAEDSARHDPTGVFMGQGRSNASPDQGRKGKGSPHFVAQVDGRNFCQGPRSASSRRVQAAPRSEGKKCWASQIPSTTHTGAPEARLRCSSRHGRKGRLWRELDLRRDVLHNL